MKELINKCSQWAEDRNLIKGSTSKDQVLKLIQEVGELSDNVCKGKSIKDDVGDCLVVLNNIALQNNTTLLECLEIAYNDIKDRRGEMRDGVFIKESDL
jgi:NTP pyrophosphatase (non-canonical NTP hydrolase)